MYLFHYHITSEDNTQAEKVVYAYSEGIACDKVIVSFPNWVSIELLHTHTIR